MTRRCERCEFMLHEYNINPCPFRRDHGFLELDPDEVKEDCHLFELVRAPISKWSKTEIINVCRFGGASPNTLDHIRAIKLEDLRAILLIKLSVEPRGRYSEIWHEPEKCWENVRHTQMWGIDWTIIDEWNEVMG